MSSLQSASPRARRHLAAMLAPLAAVVLVAGILPLLMASSVALEVIGGILVLISAFLGLMALGLMRSASIDEQLAAEAELDSVLQDADPGCGGNCTSCVTDDCAVKALPRT